MLQITDLHKAFGERVLFARVNWHLRPGDRIGLCGPNGAGKTTLLRMLSGEQAPDAGGITRPSALTVGYLPQDGLTHRGRTLFDEACLAFDNLLALQAEMDTLETALGDGSLSPATHEAMLARYSEAQEAFQAGDGYGIEARVHGVLRGLRFTAADLERPTDTFSGGWQMRIALAKLLLRRPGLLLLDEPTNHLDLDARTWLQDFLGGYPHTVVLVSHDRYFLDSVVTSIAEVGMKTLTTYTGTYSAYVVERDRRMAQLREAKRRQDEEVARMKVFIDRFRSKATKARQVQSRLKLLEKVTPIEVPPERKRVRFAFPASVRSGRAVIELANVSKRYGDVRVFAGTNVHIERGDRVALVGANGAGKSTLMRMLSGVEAPDSGTRTEGHNVVSQYFAQDEATRLDGSLTVYETLTAGAPLDAVPTVRNILGGFLFTADDVYKSVRVLSGGERTRLAVARMLLRPSNTLLLDEPTNHLDIDSTDVLLDALTDYGGTLIFVSHDRYFVDRLATRVLEIGDGDANLYPGTYEEFRWRKAQPAPAAPAPGPPPDAASQAPRTRGKRARPPARKTPAEASSPSRGAGTVSAAEHKRRQVVVRRHERRVEALRTRIADLERRIAEREDAVRTLEASMASPGFYEDTERARQAAERHQLLMWEVGDLMNQWEALEREAAEQASVSQ